MSKFAALLKHGRKHGTLKAHQGYFHSDSAPARSHAAHRYSKPRTKPKFDFGRPLQFIVDDESTHDGPQEDDGNISNSSSDDWEEDVTLVERHREFAEPASGSADDIREVDLDDLRASLGDKSSELQNEMLGVLDPAMAHIKSVHEHISNKIEPHFVEGVVRIDQAADEHVSALLVDQAEMQAAFQESKAKMMKLFGSLKIEHERCDKLWTDMEEFLESAVSRAAECLDQVPSDIDTVAAVIERKTKSAAAAGKVKSVVAARSGKKGSSTLLQSLLGL